MQRTSSPPAVLHIGIPNPMFEGHINLYVIAGDPLTLVDTGIGTPEAFHALEAGLAAHGLEVAGIQQVVLTHKHADHMGQAAAIRRASGATVWVHEDDWDGVVHLDERHEEYLPLIRERLLGFHTPEEEIDALTRQMAARRRVAEQTEAERLVDGQKLAVSGRDLEIIHTPGHTQGSICLRYGEWIFVGDHVLPTITPNIGAGEMRRTGMMGRYLASLDRVAALDDGQITALPGHGPRFTNLAERASRIREHHVEREAKIVSILRDGGPKTVYEVARALWSRLPDFHLVLGTSEVQAHLEYACEHNRAYERDGRFAAL